MQPTGNATNCNNFFYLRSCQMTPLVFTAVLYSCKYSTFKPQYNEVDKIGNMLRCTEIWPFKQLSTVADRFLLHWSGCEISCHVEDIFTSVGTTKWSQLPLCVYSVADGVVCSGMTLLWEAAAVGSKCFIFLSLQEVSETQDYATSGIWWHAISACPLFSHGADYL